MVLYLSISHQNKIISKKFAITLVKQKKSPQYISEGVIQFPLVHLENWIVGIRREIPFGLEKGSRQARAPWPHESERAIHLVLDGAVTASLRRPWPRMGIMILPLSSGLPEGKIWQEQAGTLCLLRHIWSSLTRKRRVINAARYSESPLFAQKYLLQSPSGGRDKYDGQQKIPPSHQANHHRWWKVVPVMVVGLVKYLTEKIIQQRRNIINGLNFSEKGLCLSQSILSFVHSIWSFAG